MASAWTQEDIRNKATSVAELFGQSGILVQDEGDLAESNVCILIPESCIAWLIGKAGANINEIKSIAGCNISLAKKETSVRGSRRGVATGSVASVSKAILIISNLLFEALGQCSLSLVVNAMAAGAVIGKQGGNLKLLREQTGCRVSMEKPEEALPMLGGRCLTLSHPESALNLTQAIYNIIRVKGFASPTARDILNSAQQPDGMDMYQLGQIPPGYDGQMVPDMFGYGALQSATRQQQPRFSPYGLAQRQAGSPLGANQDICVLHNKRRGKQNLQPSMSHAGAFECSENDRCKGGQGMEGAWAAQGMSTSPQRGMQMGSQAAMFCATHGKKRGSRNLTAHPSIAGVFSCLETDPCK